MTRIASKRTLPPPLKTSSPPPAPRKAVVEVATPRTIPTRVPASWYDYYPASTPDSDMRAIIREQDWRTRALADLPDSEELW